MTKPWASGSVAIDATHLRIVEPGEVTFYSAIDPARRIPDVGGSTVFLSFLTLSPQDALVTARSYGLHGDVRIVEVGARDIPPDDLERFADSLRDHFRSLAKAKSEEAKPAEAK